MAKSIWVDEQGQPWRYDSFNNHYERLDSNDCGWVSGTPVGRLRKVSAIPSTSPPTGDEHDFLKVDHNFYFVKGPPGNPGPPGPPGNPGPPGPPGVGLTLDYIFGEIPSGTKNGINSNFTLSNHFVSKSVVLYRNGLREIGYSEEGEIIQIHEPPLPDDEIVVDYALAQ